MPKHNINSIFHYLLKLCSASVVVQAAYAGVLIYNVSKAVNILAELDASFMQLLILKKRYTMRDNEELF